MVILNKFKHMVEENLTSRLEGLGTEFLGRRGAPLKLSDPLIVFIKDANSPGLGQRIERLLHQRFVSFGEDLKYLFHAWPTIKDVLSDEEKTAILTVVFETFFFDGFEIYYKTMIEFVLDVAESISDVGVRVRLFEHLKAMMACYQDDSVRARFSRVAQSAGIEFEV